MNATLEKRPLKIKKTSGFLLFSWGLLSQGCLRQVIETHHIKGKLWISSRNPSVSFKRDGFFTLRYFSVFLGQRAQKPGEI